MGSLCIYLYWYFNTMRWEISLLSFWGVFVKMIKIYKKNDKDLQNKCTNCKGIKNNTNFRQITGIQENWIQHVNRMPRNRLPRVMKHYSPAGRRNHGRPFKRLLDTWDRNGSNKWPNSMTDIWWWWWLTFTSMNFI